jgi:AcrR family transcriptional regulator
MKPTTSFLADSDRDRLLGAVATLCTELGYEEIDEETIAAHAGVPRRTLDQLFASGKEECLAAAENAILLEVVAAVSRGYSADSSEWENVIYGVEAILDLMAANPAFAYLGYIFSRQMAPGTVRKITETGHRMLEAMLDRGRDYSSSSVQPPCTALGILGGAQAIVRRELAAGRADRLPLLLPDCVYIATVPFLGQREAVRLATLARRPRQERRTP